MTRLALTLLALLTGLAGGAAGASPLINGSFEDLGSHEMHARGWDHYAALPGWTGAPIIDIRYDKATGKGEAQSGSVYAELSARGNGALSQDISLKAGTYALSFWYQAPDKHPGPAGADLSWFLTPGTKDPILSRALSATGKQGSWTEVREVFLVAGGGNFKLTFRTTAASPSQRCHACGVRLDSIALASVPVSPPVTVPVPGSIILILTAVTAISALAARRPAGRRFAGQARRSGLRRPATP